MARFMCRFTTIRFRGYRLPLINDKHSSIRLANALQILFQLHSRWKMSASVNLCGMRKPYKEREEAFTEESLSSLDPIELFEEWFELARNTPGILEPNSMALATADKNGKPSVRMVLLKGFGKSGFCFFTNYNSRKGKELEENPNASLLFFWEPLSRQIRIEGSVIKLDQEESEKYFHSRPKGSQIAAAVSNQSTPVENREALMKDFAELEEKYSGDDKVIPKPPHWGGFKVIPKVMEFWQGQTNRLHDRIRFRVTNIENEQNPFVHPAIDGWVYERLAP